MTELSRPGAGFVEPVIAELQDVPGDARLLVDQERQNVDFRVPEVMPFIGLPGQAAGGDTVPLAARCRLQELEQVPADKLLPSRVVSIDLDIGVYPEP